MGIDKEKIMGILKPKGIKIAFAAGIIGILLIFISSFIPQTEKKTEKTFSADSHRQMLESEVVSLVKSITGSKRVSVMITLDTGTQYIYADDSTKEKTEQSSQDSHNYKVVKSANGAENGLLSVEYLPVVRGIAVVCDCADSVMLKEVKSAIEAALDISSKKIYVTQYAY